MPSQEAKNDTPPTLPGVRWLDPDNTSVFSGAFGLLHCSIKGDPLLYRGVHAVRLFPISHPEGFISLRYTNAEGKDDEIGVIGELGDFPPEQKALVNASLNKQYFEHTIFSIHKIESDYGLLFFDVETDRGREQFTMPWRSDRAEDYGETGKALLESLGNRYIIPDVDALSPADRRKFTGYIYW